MSINFFVVRATYMHNLNGILYVMYGLILF